MQEQQEMDELNFYIEHTTYETRLHKSHVDARDVYSHLAMLLGKFPSFPKFYNKNLSEKDAKKSALSEWLTSWPTVTEALHFPYLPLSIRSTILVEHATKIYLDWISTKYERIVIPDALELGSPWLKRQTTLIDATHTNFDEMFTTQLNIIVCNIEKRRQVTKHVIDTMNGHHLTLGVLTEIKGWTSMAAAIAICNRVICLDGRIEDVYICKVARLCVEAYGKKIQRMWRRSISCPDYNICRRRLVRELCDGIYCSNALD
jgi:hypothetical protein